MRTLIAATSPMESAHGLVETGVRLASRGDRPIHLDAIHSMDGENRITLSSYATAPSQGLLAHVGALHGRGHALPYDDRIPPGPDLYATLSFRTEWDLAGGRAIDLHAWLVARLTDYLELAGVTWCWTTDAAGDFIPWRGTIEPSAPLGDPFVWQDGLEASRGRA
jgi:hypothetical protein